MQKIIPTLWFNFNADEAVDFYKAIFKDNCMIGDKTYYPMTNEHAAEGKLLTVEFELFGQRFMGLNGGPQFPFTNAISLFIDCKDQTEIDYYWDAFLSSGGEEQQCGWINDKYGLSWQVAPHSLMDLWQSADRKKAAAGMSAMMTMIKLDIAAIEKAFKEA